MSSLDGADPEEFESVPGVPFSNLDAVSGPSSGDGFQRLDFIVPGWGIEMRTIISQGHYIGPVEKLHEAQGPIAKCSQQPG